jgi:predicted nucleic acid-binding protein
MRVLDATFLIDYLNGVDATAEYLLAHEDERFIFPAPAYAEVLVGAGNGPDGDVAGTTADLSWGAVYETDEDTAALAGEIAGEIGPEGPFLAGMDGLIAAVGRELDAPVVSDDDDLTHEATKEIIDVEEYRSR